MLEASLARANAALAARDLLIETLRGQIARLRRMQFGASSEKLTREIAQLELALEELETESAVPEIGAAASDTPVAADTSPCVARPPATRGVRPSNPPPAPAHARTAAVRCAVSGRTPMRCSTSCRCTGAWCGTSARNIAAGRARRSSRRPLQRRRSHAERRHSQRWRMSSSRSSNIICRFTGSPR